MWVRPPLCQMNPKYGQETAPNLFGPDFTRFWIFFLLFLFFQKIQYTIGIYCIRCRSGWIFSSVCFEVTHMYGQSIYVYLHYRDVTFSQTDSPPQQLDSPWEHNQVTILHVLICSRTVRGSPHGQSDPTLGQSVCNSWQPISSWPTSSVILTVYVCFMHNIATHEQHVTYVWHFIHIRAETTEDVTIESKSEYVNEPKPVEPIEHQGRLLSISPFYNCITDCAIPICICIYRILWLDSVAHLVELSSLLFTTLPWSIACFTF